MRNEVKLIGIIALMAIIVLSMVACNRGGSSSSTPPSASTESATAPAPAASTASSSNSIDAFFAEYEQFVDDYIAALQKMMAGDLSVMAELERLGNLAESWGDRWEGFSESDFTPAQLLKMTELTERFSAAMGF